MNKKFEYTMLSINMTPLIDIEKKLNKYGKDGWELVSIYQDKLILKREINEIVLKS